MCGIVGYIGKQEAFPVLVEGLKALEYRGYDSSGVVTFNEGTARPLKRTGHVAALESDASVDNCSGSVGIAHTRWATHGPPTEQNAHPHSDCSGRVYLVHNGIIENYRELKSHLEQKGHTFTSDTDSEVIAHLIEDNISKGSDFKTALFDTLNMIRGAYALAVLDTENPETVYAARLSSPLVIGVGEGESFLASDPAALVGQTRNVVYLKDGEVAEITKDEISVTDLNQHPVPFEAVLLEWDLEQAQKGSFPHFMLKEIYEGPEVVKNAFRGRCLAEENLIKLGGLEQIKDQLKDIKRLVILACGTSYYAGLVGEYIFEEMSGIPTEVHIASEFRYRNEPFEEGTVALAISQSGETADTLAALQKAKDNGLLTLGLVNTVGSTISRDTDAGVYNHAGPEIGVASTKAFLSQLTILIMMALYVAKKDVPNKQEILKELEQIPSKIEEILKQNDSIKELAEKYNTYENFFFLGRRYNYPVALEGALKLKEISYIHSEGYGAGEMKHGPIAMIDEEFPTIAIVPQNGVAEKMYSNLEEIKARGGPILSVATEGDELVKNVSDDVIYIPQTLEVLEPLLAIVPLQLFSYYVGTMRGNNVDKPRNLAKSVTVE